MRICPHCRKSYPDSGRSTCRRDGVALVDAAAFAEELSDPLIGTTLLGRYKVLERIGVGAMGTVYKATQAGLDRPVAVKVLRGDLTADEDTVARFHREAHAMSLLTHPNTVRVFDFGKTSDGLLFFAMELLEGELLSAQIEESGMLTVRESVLVAQQILRSLAEAHHKGIVHRDLKPDNIFLAHVDGHSEPLVKVLDFGIAKVIHGDRVIDQFETQAGTVFGTPRYMSPEQARGKALDARSDLYSVGVLLYQLLVGHPPYVDDDAVIVMAKHIREKPVPPSEAAHDRPIPASLERVLMRSLEKFPARRFASAEAMEARLDECMPEIEAAARAARPPSLPYGLAVRRWLRDAPRKAVAVSAAIVTSAVAVSTYLVASSGEQVRAEPPVLVQSLEAAEPATTEPAAAEAPAKWRPAPRRPSNPQSQRPRAVVRHDNVDGNALTPSEPVKAREEPSTDESSEGPYERFD